jgi:hypothetical protein
VFWVRPPPVQLGCCPLGWLPPLFVHEVSTAVILANDTPPKDIVSAIASAAINKVMRFLIRVFLLSPARPLPLCLGTALSTPSRLKS